MKRVEETREELEVALSAALDDIVTFVGDPDRPYVVIDVDHWGTVHIALRGHRSMVSSVAPDDVRVLHRGPLREPCPSCDRDLSYPGAPGHECYTYVEWQARRSAKRAGDGD